MEDSCRFNPDQAGNPLRPKASPWSRPPPSRGFDSSAGLDSSNLEALSFDVVILYFEVSTLLSISNASFRVVLINATFAPTSLIGATDNGSFATVSRAFQRYTPSPISGEQNVSTHLLGPSSLLNPTKASWGAHLHAHVKQSTGALSLRRDVVNVKGAITDNTHCAPYKICPEILVASTPIFHSTGSDAMARVIPYGLLFRCFGSGNSLWTTVGSDALAGVIPYGLLFRCFGSDNPLWTFVGFDASAQVIPYRLLYQVPLFRRGFRCFGSGNSLWTTVGSDDLARIIPYGLLFRCFGSSISLWTYAVSDPCTTCICCRCRVFFVFVFLFTKRYHCNKTLFFLPPTRGVKGNERMPFIVSYIDIQRKSSGGRWLGPTLDSRPLNNKCLRRGYTKWEVPIF
ncbi:hypothetical protein GQ457_07G006260 [Hibiscus cannabinus]